MISSNRAQVEFFSLELSDEQREVLVNVVKSRSFLRLKHWLLFLLFLFGLQ